MLLGGDSWKLGDDAVELVRSNAPLGEGTNLDPDLAASSCMGLGLQFPQLLDLAERYVLRGDDLHQHAGMRIIRHFAGQVEFDRAADLLEKHFARYAYLPVFGQKPALDLDAIGAALELGTIADEMDPEGRLMRRGRMLALVSLCLLALSAPHFVPVESDERVAVERAVRRLADPALDRSGYSRPVSGMFGRPFDQELVERCSRAVDDGRTDDAVRSAMIVLENRLRASTNAALDVVGVDLAVKAFDRNSPLNFGQTPAEKDGLLNLFRSAFLIFRNPAAHRFGEHEDRLFHVLTMVDLLLNLIAEANTQLYKPGEHLATHETGSAIRVERAIHADLDGDGENDPVLVYSDVGVHGARSLHILVLKQAQGRWRRWNHEGVFEGGDGSRRPIELGDLFLVDLAGDGRTQVVIRTRAFEHQGTLQILDSWNGELRLVPIVEYRPPANPPPRWQLYYEVSEGPPRFADADGDGRLEVYTVRSEPWRDPTTPGEVTRIRIADSYGYDASSGYLHMIRSVLVPPYPPIDTQLHTYLSRRNVQHVDYAGLPFPVAASHKVQDMGSGDVASDTASEDLPPSL